LTKSEPDGLVERVSDAQFDIPAMYDYFYAERSEELFGDFSKEEFIEYLKLHT